MGVILCIIGGFKSVLGLYLVNASAEIPSTSWNNQKCLQTLPMSPTEGAKSPSVENHGTRGSTPVLETVPV